MTQPLRKFGKYLLLDRVAEGGMAEIFRAWAPSVDGGGRLIALKWVQPDFGEDPEFIQMFRSEIRVTMGLNHPNIVQLYDFGEFEGRPFIAMELVEGKNVKQFTNRVHEKGEFVAPELAAHVMSQVAAGLHYAHTFRDRSSGEALNIVHRDISPQNLLISYDGNLKIIDFGIAKAASNHQATKAGLIKGKPSYLSPEQIEGLTLDGRSDIFSLGTVLWETLTGRKLFSGKSDLAAVRMIEDCDKTVQPASTINTTVPPELDAIVFKALSKDREKRFKTAEEMQRALHRFIYSHKPDFDPSDFGRYFQLLFKEEIEKERREIQELNIDAKDLASLKSEMPQRPASFSTSLANVKVDMSSTPRMKRPESPVANLSNRVSEVVKQSPGPMIGKIFFPVLLLGVVAYFCLHLFDRNSSTPSQVEDNTAPVIVPVKAAPALIPVQVEIIPRGGNAQVLLNQQPINPADIKIGMGTNAKLSILENGFKPFERMITGGGPKVVVTLEPVTFGVFTLRTTPTAQAEITGGGFSWTVPTPLVNFKLPPGQYHVLMMNDLLGMKKQLDVTIRDGKPSNEDVTLDVIK